MIPKSGIGKTIISVTELQKILQGQITKLTKLEEQVSLCAENIATAGPRKLPLDIKLIQEFSPELSLQEEKNELLVLSVSQLKDKSTFFYLDKACIRKRIIPTLSTEDTIVFRAIEKTALSSLTLLANNSLAVSMKSLIKKVWHIMIIDTDSWTNIIDNDALSLEKCNFDDGDQQSSSLVELEDTHLLFTSSGSEYIYELSIQQEKNKKSIIKIGEYSIPQKILRMCLLSCLQSFYLAISHEDLSLRVYQIDRNENERKKQLIKPPKFKKWYNVPNKVHFSPGSLAFDKRHRTLFVNNCFLDEETQKLAADVEIFSLEHSDHETHFLDYQGTIISKKEKISGHFSISLDEDKSILIYSSGCRVKRIYEIKGKFKAGEVFLVRGNDRGKPAWHYVLVTDHEKLKNFKAVAKSGSLDVALYGKVLHSGFGQDPPEQVKKNIQERF